MDSKIIEAEGLEITEFVSLKDRFKRLIFKMMSLKFIAFTLQVTLGVIWFFCLLVAEIGNVGIWGIWSGYMVGAFGVYTAGNVQTKKVCSPQPALLQVKEDTQ